MNLLVNLNKQSFYFARPVFAGSIQPADGATNFAGFVPSRFNKQYSQHPVAHRIIETSIVRPRYTACWPNLTFAEETLD